MATQSGVELIAVSAEARRVVRELRRQLELSRATIEQRAKVGREYLKHLEAGRHPSVEATRLRWVVQVLQQAAARGQVAAPLMTRWARVVNAVRPRGKASGARSVPERKRSGRP